METKNCKKCGGGFVLDEDDLGFYQKMQVPPPKICPDCRFKMRALFRNETTLYSGRKCGLCGKGIVSIYNPKSFYIIYCHNCYQSDKWDPFSYAKKYDSPRTFFDQLAELLLAVPKATTYRSISSGPNINSEYVNMAGGVKNSYFLFNSGLDEDCMYSRGIKYCSEVADTYFGTRSNQAYEVVNLQQSSKIMYGKNIVGSVDCYFGLNLSGCTDCFGCVNLSNKSHYFLNYPIKPEEYRKKVNEILGSYKKTEDFKKEFDIFSLNFPRRESNSIKNTDSIGDYLYECKNVKYSFESVKSENCRYLFSSKDIKDSIGTIGFGHQSEMLLECTATGHSARVIGSFSVENSQDVLYSFGLRYCHDCIGCDGLKNAKYCILNKQYSKAEYEKLRNTIIAELKLKDSYGLIIPPELAPFSYNETMAQDNFPLSKEQVLQEGFKWEDDIQKTEGKETLQPEDIPDHIRDVSDSVTLEILRCIACKRNYKIIEQELQFYRKMNIPLPRKCFYCRHQNRIIRRGPYKFWTRNCAKCEREITTNYAPDRPEIVYCEKCYQQEVY